MFVQAFPCGPFETNTYICSCPETKDAAIVDPAPNSAPLVQSFIQERGLNPRVILLTHSHWDHIADVANLRKKYKTPIYIHHEDLANLQSPGSDGLPSWLEIEGVNADHLVEEGDVIPVGNLQFRVIHTPGHTPGGVCYYCAKDHLLLSGDTLFKGTLGNLSFPTARPKLMWESLKKLAKLPRETVVYPGHGPSTTIGAESWLTRAEELFS